MDACLKSCHLLKRACTLSEKHLSRALEGLPLNLSQAMLLLCVADGDVTSMSKLGQSLCCHKSNITQIVDHLIAEKFISRCASADDRRVQCIELTARGRDVVAKIHAGMARHAGECMQGLSKEDASHLASLLTKYIAHTEGIAKTCTSD